MRIRKSNAASKQAPRRGSMGHATGLTAALSARKGIMPRELKVNEIQEALRKDEVDLTMGGKVQEKVSSDRKV